MSVAFGAILAPCCVFPLRLCRQSHPDSLAVGFCVMPTDALHRQAWPLESTGIVSHDQLVGLLRYRRLPHPETARDSNAICSRNELLFLYIVERHRPFFVGTLVMQPDPFVLFVEVAPHLVIVVCLGGTHQERAGWNPHIGQQIFRIHFGLHHWHSLSAEGKSLAHYNR